MSNEYSSDIKFKAEGFVQIYEKETGKVLLSTHNAVHPENISVAVAQALSFLSTEDNGGFIENMVFGNGGARATSSNKYIYSVPQTLGRSASLYHQTYAKNVGSEHDDNNYCTVSHVSGNLYTDIIITATLGLNEPEDQEITNVNTGNGDITSAYTFSEIGLATKDNHLITHLCFYPVMKSSNVELIIKYTLRFQMV